MAALTFTQALEHAAVLAAQALPATLHERLSDAVLLVRDGYCFQQDDGTWSVQSATDPAQVYTHVNGQCPCDDVHFNQPPQGLCKHRLAVYLSRKTQALLTVAQDTTQTPEIFGFKTKDVPLPESPASVNVRLVVSGREVQWTLRDHDERRLATRLEALLARYPLPQPAPAPTQAEGFCSVHQVHMKWNEGKEGRKGWYSHRIDDGWCKGK